jgi:insertion element IS1 protein InsB
MDEQWSYVANKSNQRGLWYAVDHAAYVFGKRNTQKIERKNLNFRTWIKRLTRKTICFSKLELMHDTVIGLLINKVEFGRNIYA